MGDKADSEEGNKQLKEEDQILQSLVEATGIQSVMRHDLLIERNRPDYVIIEQEGN